MSGGLQEMHLSVNDEPRTVLARPMERLLDVLRHQLELTGPKEGCGEGECGSCSVLLDGTLVNSCLIPVLQAVGTKIVTVEGIERDDRWQSLQRTLVAGGGAQCGICTPGIVMAACYLLSKHPRPSPADIKEGLSGNLCRCTGYSQICESVAKTAYPEGVR
jgi:carbon-monoxide dehydrogenase small subunit